MKTCTPPVPRPRIQASKPALWLPDSLLCRTVICSWMLGAAAAAASAERTRSRKLPPANESMNSSSALRMMSPVLS